MQSSEVAEDEMKGSEEEIRKAEEVEEVEDDEDKPTGTPKSDGKLVVAEEVALGHVSWAAG